MGSDPISPILVGVAQLVERWIVAPVAVGSIPIAHPRRLRFRRALENHCIQGLFRLIEVRADCRQSLLCRPQSVLSLILSRRIDYRRKNLIRQLVDLELKRRFLIL